MFALLAAALLPAPAPTPVNDPFTMTFPQLVKVFSGAPRDPKALGEPVGSGGCGDYSFSYQDVELPPACLATRFETIVRRTWTGTDACGNRAIATQTIDVMRIVGSLDIRPQVCPNSFPQSGGGVVPLSLVGMQSFDVSAVDPSSLQLYVEGCTAGPITPVHFAFVDEATPFTGSLGDCDCHVLGADGLMDLRLEYSHQAMKVQLGLGTAAKSSRVRLILVGDFVDGSKFIASDCVRVL